MTTQATTLGYFDGDTPCTGTFYTPGSSAEALPLVLVCPAWDGLVQEVYDKAEKLSQEGYIAFVIDVLGEGKAMSDIADLQATMGPFIMDRGMLLRRLNAAVDTAKTIPGADITRIGVIGYCFGGLCALDLARSGNPDIRAAVSFHGALMANDLSDDTINTHILVLHGNDDPLVPPQQVSEFQQEMTRRQADWQLVSYGNTVHAFTRPGANMPEAGAVYNALTDRRSWQAMRSFLAEVL